LPSWAAEGLLVVVDPGGYYAYVDKGYWDALVEGY